MLQASTNRKTFSSNPRAVTARIDSVSRCLKRLYHASNLLPVDLLRCFRCRLEWPPPSFSMGRKLDAWGIVQDVFGEVYTHV